MYDYWLSKFFKQFEVYNGKCSFFKIKCSSCHQILILVVFFSVILLRTHTFSICIRIKLILKDFYQIIVDSPHYIYIGRVPFCVTEWNYSMLVDYDQIKTKAINSHINKVMVYNWQE